MDWDDGSPIETVYPTWYNPEESGPGIANHSWDTKGTYTIKARAIDIHGAESEWGELEVSMPRNKAINTPFLNFLQSHPNLFPLLQKIFQQFRF